MTTGRRIRVSIFGCAIALLATAPAANAAVGRTQGSFGVSPTGTFTYQIPIWAPPGPRGIQPQLALTYSSAGADGPLGTGWSLAGLSAITRCPKTKSQDTVPAAVQFLEQDGYCLDGNRLRLVSGSYGQDGSAYQTEMADFSLITGYVTTGGGPQYFVVQRKNGLTYEYGRTADSRNLQTAAWLLNKVSDRSGNNYVVTYGAGPTGSVGVGLPVSISYAPSSSGSATYNYSIAFTYTTRSAQNPNTRKTSVDGYIRGNHIVNTALLTNITVSSSASGTSTIVRKYNLTYDNGQSTTAARLKTVTECAGSSGTDCLVPTTMTYQEGALAVGAANTLASGTWTYVGSADLNRDGRTDVILRNSSNVLYAVYSTTSGYASPVSLAITFSNPGWPGPNVKFRDMLGNGHNEMLVPRSGVWWRYAWNGSSLVGSSTGLAASTFAAWLDVNGDGRSDYVSVVTSTSNGYVSATAVQVKLNTSVNGTFSMASTSTSTSLPTTPYCYNGGYYGCYLGLTNDFVTKADPRIDLNGDQMQDAVLALSNWYYDAYYQYCNGWCETGRATLNLVSNGTALVPTTWVQGGAYLSYYSSVLGIYGDFNNDRCTDFIYYSYGYAAACDGNSAGTFAIPLNAIDRTDWDGDGRVDVIGVFGGYVQFATSTGMGFSGASSTAIPSATENVFVLDANGDGAPDIGVVTTTGVTYYLHSSAGSLPADVLASVVDGYNFSVSATYANGRIISSGSVVYPSMMVDAPLLVVSALTVSDGIGATYTKTYAYSDPRTEAWGRGFLGYGSVATTDSRPLEPATKIYYQTDFPNTGMVAQADVFQHNGTTLISRTINTPATLSSITLSSTPNQQRYFPYIATSQTTTNEVGGSKNGLPNATSTTTVTYSPTDIVYGNLTSTSTTVTNNDAGSLYAGYQWSSTTAYTYAVDAGSNWCVGIPTQTQVTNVAPAAPTASTITRTVTNPVGYIDYVQCRPTRTVVEPTANGGAYAVTTDYLFDSFGNVRSETVTGAGMTARTTQATWGATGQFPVTVTNALLQVTQYGYDYDKGMKTSVTDPNNVGTSWHYDTFLRPTLETRADGTSTVTDYFACSDAAVPGGCQNGDPANLATGLNRMAVRTTQKASGGAALRYDWAYTDQLDRTIVTRSQTLSGGYSRVGIEYNVYGKVARTTSPCDASNCAVYWTTNTYDALGRSVSQSRRMSETDPTNHVDVVAYQGRTTVYTDARQKTKTTVTNVTGGLARTTDHDGYYVDFGYDAFGSLTSVKDSAANQLFTASYVYGVGAFQTDVTDIDKDVSTAAGQHRTYIYDALGELKSFTDAKNQTTTFTSSDPNSPYDPLGRPVTRSEPGLTTTWTWGTSAGSYNIGKLASVSTSGDSAYSESYAYDNVGRLSQQTIQGLTFDLTYGTHGAVYSMMYPTTTNGCRVKLIYSYQYGYLSAVTDNSSAGSCGSTGTVYWSANQQNWQGQSTQETLGNNVVTNRIFDAITGSLKSIQSGVGGGTGLQNFSYFYDEVGNLGQRQDNTRGLTETFCYDNLHRLDHTTTSGSCPGLPAKLQMTYYSNGNIKSRSDVAGGANWTYSATHIHQLLQAGDSSHTYAYDNNGNVGTRNGYTVSWTSYNLPQAINASGEYSGLYYGHDHQLWKQTYSGPGVSETTTYYGGLLEKVETSSGTDWRHYVYAGSDLAAIYSRPTFTSPAVRYSLEDHQGSLSVLTNSVGTPLVNESFAPFGERRNPTTWTGAPSSGDQTTIASISRMGYTGQNMLGAMGLVHMRGRVLDAVTGRFLAADPYVPDSTSTQGFNRYSYVYNNPGSYTDPSGYDPLADYWYNTDWCYWHIDTARCQMMWGYTLGTTRYGGFSGAGGNTMFSNSYSWTETTYGADPSCRNTTSADEVFQCVIKSVQDYTVDFSVEIPNALGVRMRMPGLGNPTAVTTPQGNSDKGMCWLVRVADKWFINRGPAKIDTATEDMAWKRFLDQNHSRLDAGEAVLAEAQAAVLADPTLITGPRMVTTFTGARRILFGNTTGTLDFLFGQATGYFNNGKLVGVSDHFDLNPRNPSERGGQSYLWGLVIEAALWGVRGDANDWCGGSAGYPISAGKTW